jgi:hypothetical protein
MRRNFVIVPAFHSFKTNHQISWNLLGDSVFVTIDLFRAYSAVAKIKSVDLTDVRVAVQLGSVLSVLTADQMA